MQIFLIGFMGSGKSYTAKELSNLLDMPFIDLDGFIEKEGGQSISKLFEFGGEQHFREIEHNALKTVINKYPNYIVATGGGTPIFHDNLHLMKENGLTVYLDASIEVLVSRLSNEQSKRPLLANQSGKELKSTIHELLKPRIATYSKCHIAVEIKNVDLNVAGIIAGYIRQIS